MVDLAHRTPFSLSLLGSAAARIEHPKRAHSILRELEARSEEEFVAPLHTGMLKAALGRVDDALEDLEARAAELAAETGLPVPTVQRLVSKLTGAGLLRSVRGAGGGLQLGRPAAAITVADIVEAVEGPADGYISAVTLADPSANDGRTKTSARANS